jgi:hypothetical protein
LTLIPIKNRLKSVSNSRKKRAFFESQFLHRKNGRAATAAVIVNLFNGLPQADLSGCPLELREVWASKHLLSLPGDPGIFN